MPVLSMYGITFTIKYTVRPNGIRHGVRDPCLEMSFVFLNPSNLKTISKTLVMRGPEVMVVQDI